MSEFYVERLQRHESPHGAYYAFQLKMPVSVRIYNPDIGEAKVECTCEAYQHGQTACFHIYWLFNALNAVLTDDPKNSPENLSLGELLKKISAFYNLIRDRLGSLPEQLNMSTEDISDSDSDHSETEESHISTDLKAHQEAVKDILSVFDSSLLPEEFGQDFPKDISPMTPFDKLYIPGNLAATIYAIAIRDKALYEQLRKVVNRDICAISYFSKQQMKARKVMLNLDQYVKSGPSETPESKDVDIPECARTLRLIVNQICLARDLRASQGPLGAATRMKVAEILVDILAEVVCNRDKDVYEEETAWERDDEEPERERNLYANLIGDPHFLNASSSLGSGDDFIIDRIRNFPVMEWSHLLERLTTILDHIRENAAYEGGATASGSTAFAANLASILSDYTDQAFEPSSSSALLRQPTATSPPPN